MHDMMGAKHNINKQKVNTFLKQELCFIAYCSLLYHWQTWNLNFCLPRLWLNSSNIDSKTERCKFRFQTCKLQPNALTQRKISIKFEISHFGDNSSKFYFNPSVMSGHEVKEKIERWNVKTEFYNYMGVKRFYFQYNCK